MARKKVSRSISADNTFTDRVNLVGYFNISLSGTWVGTVTVQRSFDSGSIWHDVETWTENTEEYGIEPEHGVTYHVGFKDGDYTSGTLVARLSQ